MYENIRRINTEDKATVVAFVSICVQYNTITVNVQYNVSTVHIIIHCVQCNMWPLSWACIPRPMKLQAFLKTWSFRANSKSVLSLVHREMLQVHQTRRVLRILPWAHVLSTSVLATDKKVKKSLTCQSFDLIPYLIMLLNLLQLQFFVFHRCISGPRTLAPPPLHPLLNCELGWLWTFVS